MRRHAGPAFIALLFASGIGLVWPGDLRFADTQGSGIGAAPPAISSIGPGASISPPGAVPAATTMALAPSAHTLDAPAAAAISIESQPSNLARRQVQTREPPQLPEDVIGYTWPLPHGRITDPFGPSPWGSRIVNGHLFHDGIDIATFCGDRIIAAHAGLDVAAGRKFDTTIGWVGDLAPYFARLDEKKAWWTLPISVVIDDGNGYRSIYSHFYQVVVKPGQRVKAGQLLGYEGATGRATGCHLHYGLFAPHETATFAIESSVVKRMLVPARQIARIDPLRVLPRRPGDEAPTSAAAPGSGHGIGE